MTTLSPNLPFLNRFRPLAYLLSLLAITAMAYAESSPVLFFIGFLGTVTSWFLVERPNGIPLPRILINLGVLAASLGLFYELVIYRDEYSNRPNLLLALGHFMVAILLCKLFEKKSNRDYAQILTLTLLVMVAGAIIDTSSLFYAILLAAYLALGLYAILLFHLRAETERAHAANPGSVNPTHRSDAAAIRRDIRGVAFSSAVLLVAIAIGVFLLFPRSSARDFFSFGGSSSTTGYTDHVRMLDIVHLRDSDVVVMEVKLERDGVNIGSEDVQPYFRGLVLGTYDTSGKQWIRSIPDDDSRPTSQHASPWTHWFRSPAYPDPRDVDYTLSPDQPLQLAPNNRFNRLGIVKQSYTLEITTDNVLFALAPPVTFASDQIPKVTYSPGDGVLATRGSIPAQLRYTVESLDFPNADMYGNTPLLVPPGQLGAYKINDTTIQSDVPPAIVDLAHQIAHDLLPPKGQTLNPNMIRPIAERFDTYLLTNYPYSKDFKAVNSDIDRTEDFLINRKSIGGHCEYFASAMVMLCRAVGINARMATGYHGGEYNSIGGFYVVKQKDAHAWVEVFEPRRGWTIYDPTPASRDSPASSVARWFHELGEVLQKAWLSTVVAFDNTSRNYLFNEISAFFHGTSAFIKNFFADVTFGFHDLFMGKTSPWWLRLLGFGSIGGTLYLIFWLIRHVHRRRTSQIPRILKNLDRKSQRQLAQELLFFDNLLRLLARLGPKKLPGETPREYVDKLAPLLNGATPDARFLIGTFYAIRFGTIRMTAPLRQQIDAALHGIRHELQHPATPQNP